MMRALWTAASGMIAQQFNTDVISNNLANVNTAGFKKVRAEFKDLIYQNMQRAWVLEDQGRPVNKEVGHGTAVSATVRDFNNGNVQTTDNPLDIFIDGEGFFKILGPGQSVYYTKDGSFKVSINEDGTKTLVTSDGFPVLSQDDELIIFPESLNMRDLTISYDGQLAYQDQVEGITVPFDMKIGLVEFPNAAALASRGRNLFQVTPATGLPQDWDTENFRSSLVQGALEMSNVQVVEEMVKLIIAQRAYEINSKCIQTSDEMLGIANSLRR